MKTLLKIVLLFLLNISFYLNANAQKPITWQRTYDGGYNFYDEGFDLCNADDSNFYVVGSSLTPQNNWAMKVMKINSFGDTIWTREIRNSGNIEAYAVVSDNKDGCVITGRSSNGAIFVNINKYGHFNWQRTYGNGVIQLHDIKKTLDNGYIACGKKDSINYDCYVIKIDSSGNFEWQKIILSNFLKIAYNILVDINGSYIISGSQVDFQFGDTTKIFITRLDSIGNILWDKKYRIKNKFTSVNSMQITNNGYLLSGETLDYMNNFFKIYFIKVNFEGDSIYSREIDTPQSEYSSTFSIVNENRFLFGMTREVTNTISLARIIITDSLGNKIIQKTVNDNENIYLRSSQIIENGNLMFIGKLDQEINSRDDFFVLRTDSLLNAPTLGVNNNSLSITPKVIIFPNYPNPFNPETTIKYSVSKSSFVKIIIYNVLGKEVSVLINKKLDLGDYLLNWKPINISTGIYYCSFIIDGILVKSNKIIYIK